MHPVYVVYVVVVRRIHTLERSSFYKLLSVFVHTLTVQVLLSADCVQNIA